MTETTGEDPTLAPTPTLAPALASHASFSPSRMTDNMAEWPLSRVVAHLKLCEQQQEDYRPAPCQLSTKSSLRFLPEVVTRLAKQHGLTRPKMFRYLSYHALNILRDDLVVQRICGIHVQALDAVLNDVDTGLKLAIFSNANTGYAPYWSVGLPRVTTVPLYDAFVKSEFVEAADACGVRLWAIVTVFMARAILTDALEYQGASDLFQKESNRWDAFMQVRRDNLERLLGDGGDNGADTQKREA